MMLLLLLLLIWNSQCSHALNAYRWNCLQKHKVINTKEVIFNGTRNGSEIHCQISRFQKFKHDLTTCNTSSENIIFVDHILNMLPETTECIQINIENKKQGYLPLEPHAINITAISRFPNLTCLILAPQFEKNDQLYPLEGRPNLFENHGVLKALSFNIPLTDSEQLPVGKILNNSSVECLDLTNSRGLTLNGVLRILNNIDHNTLRYLYARKFQTLGADGFVNKLNFFNVSRNVGTFPNLTVINLSQNALCRVSPGITKLAPHLETIDMSNNMLTDSHNIAFLSEIFISNSTKHVIYDEQFFPQYQPKYKGESFGTDENARPYSFSINHTRKWKFIISCVNSVSLGNCSNMAENRTMFCNFNKCIFPQYFEHNNCSAWPIFPALKTFFNPECMLRIEFPVGENLHTIMMSFLHFQPFQTLVMNGMLCIRNNSLRKVIIDGNDFLTKTFQIEPTIRNVKGFMGLQSIKHFSSKYNYIFFNQNYISNGLFQNTLPNLMSLDVSGNYIVFKDNAELCQVCPNLIDVRLRKINITHVPHSLIKNCTKLKYFRIGNNSLNLESLDNLDLNGTNLKQIELGFSALSHLSTEFTNKLDLNPNIAIDLSNNPLNCSCSLAFKKFTIWMIRNRDRLVHYKNYRCFGPSNQSVALTEISLDIFWEACHANYTKALIESIVFTLAAVGFIFIIIGFYKMRWRLKYFCFRAFQRLLYLTNFDKSSEVDKSAIIWKYDAFISYCAEDRFWVHSTLMKTLEEVYGFHLCIHYRDFPIGSAIGATICESMTNSREIILVLSDYALKSGWMHFELNEALAQFDRRKKKLIVIKLGTLEQSLLDIKVVHILENHTYLEWSDDKKSHKLFWAKLVGIIYGDPHGTCLCCPYGARALGYQDIHDPQLDVVVTTTHEPAPSDSNHLDKDLQILLKSAQSSKEKASKAQHFLNYIEEIMEQEELPYWAYGPMPRRLEELLEENDTVLKTQLSCSAHERIRLINDCLQNFLVMQRQKHTEIEARIAEHEK